MNWTEARKYFRSFFQGAINKRLAVCYIREFNSIVRIARKCRQQLLTALGEDLLVVRSDFRGSACKNPEACAITVNKETLTYLEKIISFNHNAGIEGN